MFHVNLFLQLWRTNLKNININVLTSIAADPVIGSWGPRAYVGGRNLRSLIVIETSLWWPVHLDVRKSKYEMTPDVAVETIVLSRKEPILYMTASDSDLIFSLNLSAIRSLASPAKNVSHFPHASF